jgi:hypothetical protein
MGTKYIFVPTGRVLSGMEENDILTVKTVENQG